MKKRNLFIILAVLVVLFGGLIFYLHQKEIQKLDNYPYEPDTPKPEPHNGTFVSDYGTMVFNGDGESVTITVSKELSELTGLPEGEHEGSYVFLSGDLPPHGSMPIRYDAAHEFELTVNDHGEDMTIVFDAGIAAQDGSTGSVGIGIVKEDMIPLLFHVDGRFFDIRFVKE